MKKLVLILALAAPLMASAQQYFQTKTQGTFGIDNVTTTTQNEDGSYLLAGLFQDSFTFNGEQQEFVGGNADAYLAKYDENGDPMWVKTFGGWADEAVIASTVDNNGNILITGYFQGNSNGGVPFDADPSAGTFPLNQPAPLLTRDMFIIKLTADGDFIWAKQISNTQYASNEDSYAIKADANNNVYIGGRFGQADFDPAAGKDTLFLTTSGKMEGFLLKLNENGEFSWVKHFDGGECTVRGIEFDTNGDVIIAGEFSKKVNLDSTTTYTCPRNNIFMAKFNENGDLLASKAFGGDVKLSSDFIRLIDDQLFIAGVQSGPVNLGEDSTTSTGYVGQYDAFIAQYSLNFEYIKGLSLGSPAIDEFSDLIKTNDGYLVGFNFGGDVILNPSLTITSKGNSDISLLKLDQNFEPLSALTYGGTKNDKVISLYNNNEDIKVIGIFSDTVDLNPFDEEDIHVSKGSYDIFFSHYTWDELLSSVQENLNKITVNVYPNPSSEFINIEGINNANIQVYNLQGQLVLTSTNAKVNVSNLKPGQYLVIAKNQSSVASSVFIKQ